MPTMHTLEDYSDLIKSYIDAKDSAKADVSSLGTAAAKDVPSSGNASTTQVVMGNDTRLSDSRNAKDVSSWAKASSKPTYNGSEIKTNAAKTGTAQSSITNTIAASTTMDNAVGTLLNNDKTLDTNLASVKETLTKYEAVNSKKNYLTTSLADAKEHTLSTQYHGSWSGNVYSYVGLSITFNPDCSLTIKGTQTGSPVNFNYAYSTDWDLVDGETYVLVGPEGGDATTDRLEFYKDNTKVAELYNGATYEFTYSSSSTYILQPSFRGTGTAHDITFKPMICPKRLYDADPSWQSPTLSNEELTKETTGLIDNQNVNGAVNELENNNVTNVQTETTFTVNSDKTVTVTVASTTSAPRSMEFPFNFKKGTYKLTGNPVKDDAHIKMTFYNHTDAQNITTDFGHGAVFTIDGTKRCSVYIDLRTGTPAGTYVFKPMISLASLNLSYDDYVPYAKSNRELTNDVTNILSAMASKVNPNASGTVYNITCSSNNYPRALVISNYSIGTIAYWSGAFHYILLLKASSMASVTASNESANGFTLTFSSGDIPTIIPLNLDETIWTITKA